MITSLRSFLHRLFCKHEWRYYCYNIKADEGGDEYDLITISFRDCKKCASSKLNFIFGNK